MATKAFLAVVDVLCFVGHAAVLMLCWALYPLFWAWFKITERGPDRG